MKYTYHIETPHGIITRKSEREYTHVVYNVRRDILASDPNRLSSDGQPMAKIGEDGKLVYESCYPWASNPSFCGSRELAAKEAAKRGGEVCIVEATKKGGAA